LILQSSLKVVINSPTGSGLGASQEKLRHLINNVLIRHALAGVRSTAVVKHVLEQVYSFHIFRLRLTLLYELGDGLATVMRFSDLGSAHNGHKQESRTFVMEEGQSNSNSMPSLLKNRLTKTYCRDRQCGSFDGGTCKPDPIAVCQPIKDGVWDLRPSLVSDR
jgi:hypothetical protein